MTAYLLPPGVIALAPALPLLAALLVTALRLSGAAQGEAGERRVAAVTLAAGVPVLGLLLAFALQGLILGWPGQVELGDWFASGGWRLPLSFTLDGLSLGIGVVVAFIALATLRFSLTYMHREAGFPRFFLGMNLFASGILLVVLAGNAGLVFVGWELMGLASWLPPPPSTPSGPSSPTAWATRACCWPSSCPSSGSAASIGRPWRRAPPACPPCT